MGAPPTDMYTIRLFALHGEAKPDEEARIPGVEK